MKHISILFFLLLIGVQPIYSVTISGHCKAYKGKKIELVAYYDLFNQLPDVIEAQVIKEDGSFSFNYKTKITRRISLRIKDYKANFYITPKGNYKVNLNEFNPKSAPPLSPNKYLTFDFLEQDTDSLNFKIIEINRILSNYQREFYVDYLNNRIKPKIPILERRLNIDSTQSDYLTDYKRFMLARQMLFARYSKKEIFKEYIEERYELQNEAYTELFTEFYGKWLNRYMSNDDINWLVNSIENTDLDSLKLLFRRNDFMQSEESLEMVMAKELFRESQLSQRYQRKKLILLLDTLAETTRFNNVYRTCQYYTYILNKLKVGSKAPPFKLENQDSNLVSLNAFKGKYVYLGFWSNNCPSCKKAMVLMNSFYTQYKDSIEVVSINVDEGENPTNQLLKTNGYNWTFLNGSGNLKLRDDYSVSGLPLYYLIGKDGTILQSPAQEPGGGIELLFKYLFDSQTTKKEDIWDWDQPIRDKN
ncbi:MAG: hypothetical protein CL840_02170 [Crocinitomicaceae bacterium]|nr:hypothetical protein [Crocinitomicaceae bacterium]|tara:strand:+ start:13353 stop:14777 length:1425 start_codon:yes stop_codon:yes gene_type:complete